MFISIPYKPTDNGGAAADSRRSRCLRSLPSRLVSFSRRSKQLIVIVTDTFLVLMTVWLAFSLRLETLHVPHAGEWLAYLLSPLIALPLFVRSGLYRAVFRYSGFVAFTAVMRAGLQYGAIYFFVIQFLGPLGVSRSIGVLQPLLLLLAIGGSRAMARFLLYSSSVPVSVGSPKEKLLIYGAGSAGLQIASALQHNTRYAISGFLDDDSGLRGKSINGITVFSPEAAPALVESLGVKSILLALPSTSRARRQELYHSLQNLGVQIRTLPGIEALAEGQVSVSDIREIDIADLLGRDPVPPRPELFARCIKGKTVLVTGAGGSIGSELCRQILAQEPMRLLLLEHSEYHLYALHQELDERTRLYRRATQLIPLLGDVTDRRYMQELCCSYQPDTVYHAAAYKHVPMVESNPAEGLRNNVFGTLSIAEAAKASGAGNFVLVSTDKAVRPTNVMGASKRIAELILQAMAVGKTACGTCFSMVRFGNVLGSSGSVVPLFRRQIAAGGPVTVTHEDVTRYFMTIPEAAQLVIQAGAMAEGGDVFLLDMGEPVRIVDLAARMVELSGLALKNQSCPDGDIEIVVTGLRPGEKLYEELLIGECPMSTPHPRIFKANEHFVPWDELEVLLEELGAAIRENDARQIRLMLSKILSEYAPQNDGLDRPADATGTFGLDPVAVRQPVAPEKGRNAHAGRPRADALPSLACAGMPHGSRCSVIDGEYVQEERLNGCAGAFPPATTKTTEPKR